MRYQIKRRVRQSIRKISKIGGIRRIIVIITAIKGLIGKCLRAQISKIKEMGRVTIKSSVSSRVNLKVQDFRIEEKREDKILAKLSRVSCQLKNYLSTMSRSAFIVCACIQMTRRTKKLSSSSNAQKWYSKHTKRISIETKPVKDMAIKISIH